MTPPILGIFASAVTGGVSATSFESIATVTVGSGGAASAEFTSIPGTYTHLQVRMFAKTDRALNRDGVRMRMNSVSTGSPYAWHGLYGDGASALVDGGANLNEIVTFRAAGNTSATNIWGGLIIDVLDYANTNKNTTIRCLGGVDLNGAGEIWLSSGLWNNTSAITTLTFTPNIGSNFLQYSHFALYGCKSA
jgi:hypothetical protein